MPCNAAFVDGFVQEWAVARRIAGEKDGKLADLHGLRVNYRATVWIHGRADFLETEPGEVGCAANTDQQLVDHNAVRARAYPQAAGLFDDLGRACPDAAASRAKRARSPLD